MENFENGKYNPHIDESKLQHPYAEFELYAVDSSYMFMISDNEELISKFKNVTLNILKCKQTIPTFAYRTTGCHESILQSEVL